MSTLASWSWRIPWWMTRVFIVSPIAWVLRKLPMLRAVLVIGVVLTVLALETFTSAYWLALGLYYEARGESLIGQYAVANVVYNRVDDARWPSTVKGVINDGLERGRSCDFSFMCDGKPENPWLHHRKYWWKWLLIRAEAWSYVALRSVGLMYDPTRGALFYKRKDTYSPWFAKEIAAGRMKRVPRDFGAHEFFTGR